MSEGIIPIDKILLPEHFATHVINALGDGFTVESPRNFAHAGSGSFFKVTCPPGVNASWVGAAFATIGAQLAPAHIRCNTNQFLFHVPNINAAKEMTPKIAKAVWASVEEMKKQQAFEAAKKAADSAKLSAINELIMVEKEYRDYFGHTVTPQAFTEAIHVGQYGLGFNPVMLKADSEYDVVFDSIQMASVIIPKGSFHEQILTGQVDTNRQWAIYHDPMTKTVRFFGGAHNKAGRKRPQRLAELATSYLETVQRLKAISGESSVYAIPRVPGCGGGSAEPIRAACTL